MKGEVLGTISIQESLLYLTCVKQTFLDEPAKYKELITVVSDYAYSRIDFASCVARVHGIVKDHWHLLLGFSLFIPKCKTRFGQLQSMVATKVPPMADALHYACCVQQAFRHDHAKYREFVRILFTAHSFDEATAIAKLEELMKGNWNLLLGFSVFLSSERKITISPKTEPKITVSPKREPN